MCLFISLDNQIQVTLFTLIMLFETSITFRDKYYVFYVSLSRVANRRYDFNRKVQPIVLNLGLIIKILLIKWPN